MKNGLPPERMRWMAQNLTQAMKAADMTQSEIFRTVIAHLGPERTVVDVGAGIGRFSIPLAREGSSKVWAVEPDPQMREHLARHLAEAGESAARVTVVPKPWPTPDVPPVEVALSTYVLQLADDPVEFARAMERTATRQVVIALHCDPMPTAELIAQFEPHYHVPPRFDDLYAALLDGGLAPRVRIVEEVQYPRFDHPGWGDEMIERLGLQQDTEGQARVRAWIAEKTADGTLGRPHRFALLTWDPASA